MAGLQFLGVKYISLSTVRSTKVFDICCLDCEIDGEALTKLVTDFDEFSALVTAPLARLRIKKFQWLRSGK